MRHSDKESDPDWLKPQNEMRNMDRSITPSGM